MADVVVYGFPQSGFVRTACMALEEKGVDYVREDIDMGSESHRALHPFAKMPILKHEDFVLYETSAITRYIDQVFDGPALQPSDARACARMSQWISAHNHYYIATIARELLLPRLLYPSQGIEADEDKIAQAMPDIEHQLSVADQTLSQSPYLAGDALSLADLFVIPIFAYLEMTPEGDRLRDPYPAVERWREAMKARPSFAATAAPLPS
ncbi:MAG: glutathione S-transferase family protein [Alphaproteobacteria bacterium]|nr:glutathione S-transferase family protein [Alphaproteobacteria bacterium]